MIARLKTGNARIARWYAPSLVPGETAAVRSPTKPSLPESRPASPAEPPPPSVDEDAAAAAAAAAAVEALRAEKAAEGYAAGLARGVEEGRAQGRSEGYEAGRQAAEADAAAAVARIAKVFDALGGEIKKLDDAVEDAIVALALEIARRVIGAEVARSHEALAGLIRQVLAEIPIDTGTPHVLLHPDDVAALQTHLPDIGNGKVQLVPDDTIEPGGCRILADGIDHATRPDRRWIERSNLFEGDLTLAARWRAAMLAMFD